MLLPENLAGRKFGNMKKLIFTVCLGLLFSLVPVAFAQAYDYVRTPSGSGTYQSVDLSVTGFDVENDLIGYSSSTDIFCAFYISGMSEGNILGGSIFPATSTNFSDTITYSDPQEPPFQPPTLLEIHYVGIQCGQTEEEINTGTGDSIFENENNPLVPPLFTLAAAEPTAYDYVRTPSGSGTYQSVDLSVTDFDIENDLIGSSSSTDIFCRFFIGDVNDADVYGTNIFVATSTSFSDTFAYTDFSADIYYVGLQCGSPPSYIDGTGDAIFEREDNPLVPPLFTLAAAEPTGPAGSGGFTFSLAIYAICVGLIAGVTGIVVGKK